MTDYIRRFISEGYEVFSSYEKPDHLTNYEGDPEYTEYQELLKNVSKNDLTMDMVGHVGWGPLIALLPDALNYYMPKLIEFALLPVYDKSDYPFFVRMVDLFNEGPESDRFKILGHEQSEYILRVLFLIKALYYSEVQAFICKEELESAIVQWQI